MHIIKRKYYKDNVLFQLRRDYLKFIIRKYVTLPFHFAEFGVYQGTTAGIISKELDADQKLYLFDSFEGLPEDWTKDFPKGKFKLSTVPNFPSNCVLYKGWFKDTIPSFVVDEIRPLAFVHIDCDLYKSTREVLFGINDLIIPGTILLFDEYHGYANSMEHEAKALSEWLLAFNREIKELESTDYMQSAFMVVK